jgi:hypothetical protein
MTDDRYGLTATADGKRGKMYMCAWVAGFGRGWRGFGLVLGYIGAVANR